VKRREFITLLGGAAVWPLAVHAQQDLMRRIGVLIALAESDPEAQARVAALRQALQELSWIEGRNIRIDYRFAGGDADRLRAYAEELVAAKPNVIFAGSGTALAPLQRATRTVPIVFAQVSDPVGSGFVASLARPGGNITGFAQLEVEVAAKWLELLKQIAPGVARVAAIHDPANPASAGHLRTIEGAAPALGVRMTGIAVRNPEEIERAVSAYAGERSGGLIVLPGPTPSVHRDLIIALAARYRLPAVYGFRYWVASGGLASYGIDNIALFRQAASYVHRILKGEKPGDLPVQHASKFELVINLKTAKALGLDPPISLLARTDEMIE
jgi:putative ABC transport system substrate-binding protein